MNMTITITSATQPNTMNMSSPFVRGAIIGRKRAERWAAKNDRPLHWELPRNVWLTTDLFAEGVPDEWIDRVFAVMALAPRHTFLVLTKRAARMRRWLTIQHDPAEWRRHLWFAAGTPDGLKDGAPFSWPIPNCWLGVSVEDQARADERIPELLATPAAKRFISAEPLLGPVDLRMLHYDGITNIDALTGLQGVGAPRFPIGSRLDWTICGGESGPGARPMHPDWARALRDQCQAAGVPFFFKRWGEFAPHRAAGIYRDVERVDFADGICMLRVGKRAAGRLLDGREHSEFPA